MGSIGIPDPNETPLDPQHPVQRGIVGVDAVDSTSRTNPQKIMLRDIVFDLTDQAFTAAGIPANHRETHLDRGDGAINLIRPDDTVSEPKLIDTFAPTLNRLLLNHNATSTGRDVLVRVAIGSGYVHGHRDGWAGTDLEHVYHLLNCQEFKDFRAAASEPCVVAVTDLFYRSIVTEYDHLADSIEFTRPVTLQRGERSFAGWFGRVSTVH